MSLSPSERIGESESLVIPTESLTHRKDKAAFYQYMREEFPFLLATSTPSPTHSTIVTVDTSLYGLLSMGLSPSDTALLYCFIKNGPLHSSAVRGIHIGAELTRDTRTLVYRALSEVCRRLDSKTKDFNGVSSAIMQWNSSIIVKH